MTENGYSIAQAARKSGLSADTLRYYEKIGLLPDVRRNYNSHRVYSDRDLSALAFIRRSQKMGFSLAEIARLLLFRKDPIAARPEVRELAEEKLQDIENRLDEMTRLRDELRLLVHLCRHIEEDCPILGAMMNGD